MPVSDSLVCRRRDSWGKHSTLRRQQLLPRRLFPFSFFIAEVTHTPEGKTLLANFCLRIAGAAPTWSMAAFLAEAEESIRRQVGPEAHVIGAVSGGVDSTVAAVLLNR